MSDEYTTISAEGEGKHTEKMSRFLSFAFPVTTADEAKAAVVSVTRRYHDARHVCWAYMLGADRSVSMSNDNGEPSGTAGKPILGQINSFGLTDVAVVVVRYFGGIKLGIPGLIRAYKTSTEDALSAATIVEKTATEIFRLDFDYLQMNNVMKILKDLKAEILSRDFGTGCTVTAQVRLSLAEDFLSRISDIENCSVEKPVPVQDSVETGDIQN